MPPLAAELFDYSLPAHLVAQTPAARRDQSRLLVVNRATRAIAHRRFADLPEFLRNGDLLIRNNAAVLPARLRMTRATGGQVECFLLRPSDGENTWRCLVKPGRKLPVGTRFSHTSGSFSAEIMARELDGSAVVRFETPGHQPIAALANQVGEVPLPPYIARPQQAAGAHQNQRASDLERYQTVYADKARQVAVAAPTAGLHFTEELLATLGAQGVRSTDVTLHVGLGTFKPITTDTIEAHPIHRELYELPGGTQQALFSSNGRRIAIGTTTVRTIEDFLETHSAPLPADATCFGEASIFIYPPRRFRGVDALITNFHQPRSTLLCLVAAFLSPGTIDGISWLHEIYREAIAREYRFFSYGDAMLIV